MKNYESFESGFTEKITYASKENKHPKIQMLFMNRFIEFILLRQHYYVQKFYIFKNNEKNKTKYKMHN